MIKDNVTIKCPPRVGIDPFAPVRLEKMMIEGIPEIPRVDVVAQCPDGPRWIATNSDSYLLVPNEEVVRITEAALAEAGLPPRLVEVAWNGKKFGATYEIPGSSSELESQGVMFAVEGVNSYDGTLAFGIRFLARRLVCSNGLYFSKVLGSFSFKHLKANEWDISDAIKQLRDGAERFILLAPYIRAMQDIPVDLRTVLEWHKTLTLSSHAWPDSKTGDVLAALRESGDRPTMWDLLNAFTFVTSHAMEPFSGARQSEKICNFATAFVKGLGGGM